jgi:hypothetical protein
MKMISNIPVWGEHEEKTLKQIETCAATADKAALMADGHLGYAVPIGGVIAYKDAISPSGVGLISPAETRLSVLICRARSCVGGSRPSCVRVLHTLMPVGVAMAGADEFDPYKN